MSQDIWQHPETLTRLLSELNEPDDFNKKSRLILTTTEQGTLTLTGVEVSKLLESDDTVSRFFETVSDVEEGIIVEIHNFEVDTEVMEKLEELFEYVEVQ